MSQQDIAPLFPDPAGGMARLQRYLDTSIPLVAHMQFRVAHLDDKCLSLSAPLQANRNHIGTAFGGSLHGLATLASWGLLWVLLEDIPDTHIVIQESRMAYLQPVKQDFEAMCLVPNRGQINQFRRALKRRGKARIELHAEIRSGDTLAANFTGYFVAVKAA